MCDVFSQLCQYIEYNKTTQIHLSLIQRNKDNHMFMFLTNKGEKEQRTVKDKYQAPLTIINAE